MRTEQVDFLTMTQQIKAGKINFDSLVKIFFRLELVDVGKYIYEFNKLKLKDFHLTEKFEIDLIEFSNIVLNHAKHKYTNFCFINDNKNLSMMVQFSEIENGVQPNDSVFLFEKTTNPARYKLTPSDIKTYLDKRTDFNKTIGAAILNETPTYNTEIISYNTNEVLFFCFLMISIVYDGDSSTDKNPYLLFQMIKFDENLISTGENNIKDEIRKRNKRISFAVCTVYEDNAKSTKQTASYDVGSLNP